MCRQLVVAVLNSVRYVEEFMIENICSLELEYELFEFMPLHHRQHPAMSKR